MINNTPYQLDQQTNDITLEELYGLNNPGVHVKKVISGIYSLAYCLIATKRHGLSLDWPRLSLGWCE